MIYSHWGHLLSTKGPCPCQQGAPTKNSRCFHMRMVTESRVRSCRCGPKELPWPVGLSRGLALSTEQVGQVGNAEDSSAWFPSEGWEGKPCSALGCSLQPRGWCVVRCVWGAFLGGFQQEENVLGLGFWGGRLLMCHLHLVADIRLWSSRETPTECKSPPFFFLLHPSKATLSIFLPCKCFLCPLCWGAQMFLFPPLEGCVSSGGNHQACPRSEAF